MLEVKNSTRRFKPLRKLLKVDASENISQKGMVIHLKASYRVGRSIAADWKAVISEAVSILHRIVMLKIPQLLQSSEKNTIYNFTPEVHAYQPSDEAAGEVFLRWYYWNISLRSWELALTSWISLSLIPWSYRIVKVAMNGFSIELTNPVAPDRFWSAKIKAF